MIPDIERLQELSTDELREVARILRERQEELERQIEQRRRAG